jgi:sugar transferase (PEP-CTERM/EpsH1 system associated)
MTTLPAPPARPAVLYLVHRVAYPPDKGERIRAFHLLRFLSHHASVHLACLADEPVGDGVLEALGRYAARVAVFPVGGWSRWGRALGALLSGRTASEGAFHSGAMSEALASWCADATFHASLSSSSVMAGYQRLPGLRGVPAVVDLIDVDSQKWFDYARASRWPRSWLYGLEGRRLRRLERGVSSWARALTVVTEAEADLLREFAPQAPVHAVGNGVDLDYFRPASVPEEPACVFVGVMDYRPNVDAACWFCREVWPAVRRARPEARVYLVGRRPAPAVRALAAVPGVEVVGQVADVRPYLWRSAVSVAPLRIARGVQNKVLEALATAKAVVASPTTLAGLRGASTPGVCMASSAGEWAEAVLRLLDDAGSRRRLGEAGRRYVAEHHCWDHCLEPFLDLLGLSRREGPGPEGTSPGDALIPHMASGLPGIGVEPPASTGLCSG